jgi:MFS family permease
MFQRLSLQQNRGKQKLATANIILVANAFIWYLLAFNFIKDLAGSEILLIIGINTGAIALSGLLGTFVVDKFRNRRLFFYLWLSVGVVISVVPLAINSISVTNIAIIALIFGLYFGIGMPATMGYHSGFTNIEGRAKIGGITFLVIGATFAIIDFVALNSILELCIVLATVRVVGLIVFHLVQVKEEQKETIKELNRVKYRNIIQNKSFILYFVPWLMITLVNFLTVPIFQKNPYPNYDQLSAVEYVVIAIVAAFSGFIADKWGRKRLSIIGFIILGMGYAVIGLAYASLQNNMLPYGIAFTILDGIAWGVFYMLFLFTLWGDLGQNKISDKFYFLGALPYVSSYFLTQLFDSSLSQFSTSTIFAFASVFLFLAVLPLVYAPETLPEKVMKDRDLKSYVESAKRKAQKESEKVHKKDKTIVFTDDANYEEAAKLAEKYY